MKKILLTISFFIILTACRQAASSTNIATDMPSASVTQMVESPQPAINSRTPRPTLISSPTNTVTLTPTTTPTAIEIGGNPVRMGTPLPEVEPITLDNINQLEEIGQWGIGEVVTIQSLEEQNQVLAITTIGMYWFNMDTFEEENYQSIDLRFCDTSSFTLYSTTPYTGACIDSANKFIRIFNIISGEMIQNINIPANTSFDYLWFSYDKSELYASTCYSKTRVWDMKAQSWKEDILDFALYYDYSADGEIYLTVPMDGVQPTYVYKKGEIILDASSYSIGYEWQSISLSDDGKYIVMGGYHDPEVIVWDVENNEEIFSYCFADICDGFSENQADSNFKLTSPSSFSIVDDIGDTGSAYLSPDNRFLLVNVYASEESGFYVIDFTTGEVILESYRYLHQNLIFLSDNEHYISGGRTIFYGKIDEPEPIHVMKLPTIYGEQVEFSENGELGVLDENGTLSIFDIENGISKYGITSRSIFHFQFFHQSPRVLIGNYSTIEIWNYEQGTYQEFESDWRYYYLGFDISSNDQLVVIKDPSDGPNKLLNIKTGEYLTDKFGSTFQLLPHHTVLVAWEGFLHETVWYDFTSLLNPIEINRVKFENCAMYTWLPLPSGNGSVCNDWENEVVTIYDYDGNVVMEIQKFFGSNINSIVQGAEYIIENDLEELFDSLSADPIQFLVEVYPFPRFFPAQNSVISSDNRYIVTTSDGLIHIYGVPTEKNNP